MQPTSNIVLIGFMGVGKGSLARELAEATGFFAVDSDDLIESLENRKIKKIFKDEGEPYFRTLEKKVAAWFERHVSQTIISTGGGFFAVENLKRIGTVVFLDADFESILETILNHPQGAKKLKKRPLFQDSEQARELFDRRRPLYMAKADVIIKVAGKTVREIGLEVRQKLKI